MYGDSAQRQLPMDNRLGIPTLHPPGTKYHPYQIERFYCVLTRLRCESKVMDRPYRVQHITASLPFSSGMLDMQQAAAMYP